jgi:acyl dehydratase
MHLGEAATGSASAAPARRVASAGDAVPERRFRVTRADLIKYIGASHDFNPIHYSDRIAREAGLPGVIAHGMLTMALVGRAITDWAGDAGAVIDYGVRFIRPVEVPDDDLGAEVVVAGVVKSVQDGVAQLDMLVTCNGEKVLTQAKAVVRVAPSAAV